MSTARVDIVERVSYVSSTTKDKTLDYEGVMTPNAMEDGGALRAGATPHLLSRQSIGLLAQYAAVGLVYGTLPSTIYPFLQNYLNMEGTATTSATALLSIPWSLKVFLGMVSDNLPIFGYRRRPYMIIGWSMAAVCLFVMALMPMPDPYFIHPSDRHYKPEEYAARGITVRTSAKDAGGKYIVLMMLASLGYLISDVAADAVVVEYAQREPEAIRGRTQTAIYTTRTFFSIFASVILAFGLNGKEYGGDFEFGISFATVMLILAIFCVPVAVLTWFFIEEQKYDQQNFSQYIATLWEALQSRAFYQVIGYNFFSGVFQNMSYVSSYPIQSYWVKATNLNYNISNILAYAVMVFTLIATGKFGLHWNWRWVIATTMLSVVGIDAICSMLVTWDVVRNQWFWLGVPIVEQVPASMSFIVSTFVVVELAGEGNEGACYGLLTTVTNLSSPFALTITKNIDAQFDVWNDDIQADTTHVRKHVTITILIAYVFKLASLGFLVWLPQQKRQAQELKRHGGKSKAMGMITVFYCLFALVWSIMTNLFAIFESTKCLKITGGCKE
ncbi:hypothetical protein PINS_up024145 [Pythium insidiosum]|nr:hypothetical protein PINS_up005172 [Pythium insidiosum]GLE11615.1 hypothetical protein PINS_up024145 [Pythium insidiosum]